MLILLFVTVTSIFVYLILNHTNSCHTKVLGCRTYRNVQWVFQLCLTQTSDWLVKRFARYQFWSYLSFSCAMYYYELKAYQHGFLCPAQWIKNIPLSLSVCLSFIHIAWSWVFLLLFKSHQSAKLCLVNVHTSEMLKQWNVLKVKIVMALVSFLLQGRNWVQISQSLCFVSLFCFWFCYLNDSFVNCQIIFWYLIHRALLECLILIRT